MPVESSILISGGDVVGADSTRRADVLVRGELIEVVGEDEAGSADRVIDATGKLVIPGAVDVHTHLDMEVGVTRSADDFFTGTRAAACGGTTTVIDFATAYRGERAAEGLAKWHDKARDKAVIDYGFHMTVTELAAPAHDIVSEMAAAGVISFKLYMTYPDRLMVPDEVIREMLQACGDAGSLLLLHCEDDDTISVLRSQALAAGHTQPPWHARSRPPGSEAMAVARAIAMAEEVGAPVYIVHLSSAEALDHVRSARARGVPVFAETCPHYLFLTQDLLDGDPGGAANFICSPPLRRASDRDELWSGLRDGDIQVVSTDHCPFSTSARRAGLLGGGWKDFTEIPGGLPGIETRLGLVYQRVRDGFISAERWVELCCTAPSKLFGLYPRKGVIAPGADADIVVFDPRATKQLVAQELHMATDHSPYAEMNVTGWPEVVLAGGRIVVEDGEPVPSQHGRFVARSGSAAGQS